MRIHSASPPTREQLKALFDELGELRLRALIEKFYRRMKHDLLIGFFFDGKNIDHIANQQTLFLLRSMGVSNKFEGNPPSQAHTAVAPILKGHFDRRMMLLKQVLQEEGASTKAIETWVAFEESFRKQVQD